jgi:DNA-binding response OmpR family regulator
MSRRGRNRSGGGGEERRNNGNRQEKPAAKNGANGGGQKPQRQDRRKGRGSSGRNSKANMVILIDRDQEYVEMQSKSVVSYISGYNPMGFTEVGRAISYLSNPRNKGRVGMVMLNMDVEGELELKNAEELIGMLKADQNVLLALVSESNSAEKLERALAVGANGLLAKPYTIERFVRFVKGILRSSQSTAWQCEACGKMVIVEQVDMLKMKPIKCSDRECCASELRQLEFPPES